MKNIVIVFSLFTFVMSFSACAQKTKAAKTSDLKCIACTAGTRGYQEEIRIEQTKITVHKVVRGVAEDKVIPITKAEWSAWEKQVKSITLAKISSLNVPSAAHQYDGALACGLSIETKTGKFESVTFDKGNPPAELKSLMAKISKL
jgi:hypothetical protein